MKIPNIFRLKQKQINIDTSDAAARIAYEKSIKVLVDSHEIGNNLKQKLEQNGITLQLMAATRGHHD